MKPPAELSVRLSLIRLPFLLHFFSPRDLFDEIKKMVGRLEPKFRDVAWDKVS